MITKSILSLITLFIIGSSLLSSSYFYQQYEKIKKNPNIVAQEEAKKLASKVGEFMKLPTDEDPSVATVVDKDKLKDQPFFKDTDKGDKILIYSKAKKAILYRPSTNKIIEFAPLAMGEDQSAVLGSETQSLNETETQIETTKIVLLNGSKTVGLTADAEKKIKEINGTEILFKNNAAKNDYTSNLVIDLTGGHDALVKQLAQTIGGEVVSMVDGEQKPTNADILIIVAK